MTPTPDEDPVRHGDDDRPVEDEPEMDPVPDDPEVPEADAVEQATPAPIEDEGDEGD